MNQQPLFSDQFLLNHLYKEYEDYCKTIDANFLKRLIVWAEKNFQKETTSEGTFVETFFKKTWGYKNP